MGPSQRITWGEWPSHNDRMGDGDHKGRPYGRKEEESPSPQSFPRMGEEGREAPHRPAAVGSCFRRNDERGWLPAFAGKRIGEGEGIREKGVVVIVGSDRWGKMGVVGLFLEKAAVL